MASVSALVNAVARSTSRRELAMERTRPQEITAQTLAVQYACLGTHLIRQSMANWQKEARLQDGEGSHGEEEDMVQGMKTVFSIHSFILAAEIHYRNKISHWIYCIIDLTDFADVGIAVQAMFSMFCMRELLVMALYTTLIMANPRHCLRENACRTFFMTSRWVLCCCVHFGDENPKLVLRVLALQKRCWYYSGALWTMNTKLSICVAIKVPRDGPKIRILPHLSFLFSSWFGQLCRCWFYSAILYTINTKLSICFAKIQSN